MHKCTAATALRPQPTPAHDWALGVLPESGGDVLLNLRVTARPSSSSSAFVVIVVIGDQPVIVWFGLPSCMVLG